MNKIINLLEYKNKKNKDWAKKLEKECLEELDKYLRNFAENLFKKREEE